MSAAYQAEYEWREREEGRSYVRSVVAIMDWEVGRSNSSTVVVVLGVSLIVSGGMRGKVSNEERLRLAPGVQSDTVCMYLY